MKVSEFLSKAKNIEALETKYKLGTFLNKKSSEKLLTDCSGMIKGILWGYPDGGKYASNGVPDINADTMISRCSEVTTDFTKMKAGWIVWMKGHVGVHIGDGIIIEATSAWNGCVQRTFAKGSGYTNTNNLKSRKWTKCGKLDKYIDYEEVIEAEQYQLIKVCKVYKTANNAKNRKDYVGYYATGKYYVFNESGGMINITKKAGVAGGWINPEDNTAGSYYPKYTGSSTKIDTVLKAIGVPDKYIGSWLKRLPVAKKQGISVYTGSASQNSKLISLAKQGKMLKV